MKKKWEKPMLNILVRGKPEESVLTTCKSATASGQSGASYNNCGTLGCDDCTVGSSS